MQNTDREIEMVRIPGLYRHWELPLILRLNEAFQVEDAGAHADGTPLLAVYSTHQNEFARVLSELWTPGSGDPSRPCWDGFPSA